MDLSIVIPIFNTECEKLRRCFDSVRGIEALEFECLLIDDGSEAFVGEFCRDYAKEDPRFVYYRQENAGVSAARNTGIDMAKGEYICFVDSDDMIYPDVYNTPGLLDGTADMIVTDLVERVGEKEEHWYAFDAPGEITYETAVKRLVKDGEWNGPYCKLIKLSFLKEADIRFPYGMIQGEDAVFLCRVLKHNPKMKYLDIVSYLYFHSYSNGNQRFIHAPVKCIDNAAQYYNEVMDLIGKAQFSENEKEQLRRQRTESYINELFGRALDSIQCGVSTNALQKTIRQQIASMDGTICAMVGSSTRLKLALLRMPKWSFLRIVVSVRAMYYKAAGLR